MNDFLEKKLISEKIKRYIPKNKTIANYKPFQISNNLIFISGQLPLTDKGIYYPGKIKSNYNDQEVKTAIEITTSNLLWNLSDAVNSVKKKVSIIECCNIKGYLNCEENFEKHPTLLNFSSDIIVRVLGEYGKHSRVALGVSSLPLNSCIEIEGIFSIS